MIATEKSALIVIDFVNDFVCADGALTCGLPAQNIDSAVAALVNDFADKFVVAACDAHITGDLFHPETELFPPHCLVGTSGAELYGETAEAFEKVGTRNRLFLQKTRYSAFAGTNLDMLLRARGIQILHLAGVCTDICVLHTAVDAYNSGYKIAVHKDAVASFNQVGHDFAIAHFKNTLGAQII